MNDWNRSSDSSEGQPHFLVRWIKKFFRWFKNFFALIGFVYTVVPIVIILMFFNMSDGTKSSKGSGGKTDSSAPFSLWLDLDSPILEHEPRMGESLIRQLFGREEGVYLPSIRSALRSAAADTHVSELKILIDGLSGSTADLEELRSILEDFKASGKPITTWVTHMDNAALLVASVADKIHLNPVAEVSLPGPAFSLTYFGDALKKLGVEMQVIRTGKFKSAFEPFITNEPSQESKEALGSVEHSMRDQLIRLVAKGRKKQDSEVNLWFRESFFTPAKAKELGIIDELSYPPVIDVKDQGSRSISDYTSDETLATRLTKGYSLKPDEGLALIEAVGEIVDSSDQENSITPKALEEELEWASKDDNVKAVVLRISSPGGSAAASDYIWDRISKLNSKKPVIISMGSVAASGGYYLASGGQRIFADATTITGSIGVIGMLPNLDGLKEKWGVSFHAITQSSRSQALSGKKLTSQDISYIQATIDDVYRTFKSRVAESRKMSMEQVEKLAQGRIYTGQQAKELGLVDEVGTLKDAFQFAKKAGGLDEGKLYPIHRYEPAQMALSECIESFQKLKKCFRHHGSQIRSSLKQELIGPEFELISRTQKIRELTAKERILTLNFEMSSLGKF